MTISGWSYCCILPYSRRIVNLFFLFFHIFFKLFLYFVYNFVISLALFHSIFVIFYAFCQLHIFSQKKQHFFICATCYFANNREILRCYLNWLSDAASCVTASSMLFWILPPIIIFIIMLSSACNTILTRVSFGATSLS